MKVAVAQIACAPARLDVNLERHLALIAEARRRTVDLLLFPELSLTDYLAAPDCPALALPEDAPQIASIMDAAGAMGVSFGFIERARDGRFFNTQMLVDGRRRLGRHRKLNIPTYGNLAEGRFYAAGSRLDEPVAFSGHSVSTLICADLWNPALPWLAALAGADLLLAPVASSLDAVGGDFDNPSGWDLVLRHTAVLYGLPVLFANHCGSRGDLRFWGGSRILDAEGRTIASASAEEALIEAEIDPAAIATARRRLPTMRDAHPDLIARHLNPASRQCPAPT
ncbi:MAG: hypothetical protein IPL88_02115 [Rhizobiales bacterium]|nr:hypothetical protein [Hyphomicrobiales bacterium]